MKPIALLTALLFLLFSCSDDKDSSTTKDERVFYKVTSAEIANFTWHGDTLTLGRPTSHSTGDSVYLGVQGLSFYLYVSSGDTIYSMLNTNCVLGEYPNFSITNKTSVDAEPDSSGYVDYSGRVEIFRQGVSFLFYQSDSSGIMGTAEFEDSDLALPLSQWELSDTSLVRDWRSLFGL